MRSKHDTMTNVEYLAKRGLGYFNDIIRSRAYASFYDGYAPTIVTFSPQPPSFLWLGSSNCLMDNLEQIR